MSRLQHYWQKHFRFSFLATTATEPEPDVSETEAEPRASKQLGWKVWLLKVVPWLCSIQLALSFWLDDSQWQLTALGLEVQLAGLLRATALAGLIGFGTNWLAIKMLFHPRNPRPLLGHGLVPAQRVKIAHRVAHGIHQHILNERDLFQRLQESELISRLSEQFTSGITTLSEDHDFQLEVSLWLSARMTDYLNKEDNKEKLISLLDEQIRDAAKGKLLPSLYLKLNKQKYQKALNSVAETLPAQIGKWVEQQLPGIMQRSAHQWATEGSTAAERTATYFLLWAARKANIRELLERQIVGFEMSKLEDMLWGSTNQQLLYIQYLGGWLGMLGGLFLWNPAIAGTLLGGTLMAVLLADGLLHRLQQRGNRP